MPSTNILFFCSPDSPLGAQGNLGHGSRNFTDNIRHCTARGRTSWLSWAGWMHQKWKCNGMSTKHWVFLGLFNLFNRNSAFIYPATCENKISKKSQDIMSASTKKKGLRQISKVLGFTGDLHVSWTIKVDPCRVSGRYLPTGGPMAVSSDPRCSILQKLSISIISSKMAAWRHWW